MANKQSAHPYNIVKIISKILKLNMHIFSKLATGMKGTLQKRYDYIFCSPTHGLEEKGISPRAMRQRSVIKMDVSPRSSHEPLVNQ